MQPVSGETMQICKYARHKEWQYQKGIVIFFYRPLTDTRTRKGVISIRPSHAPVLTYTNYLRAQDKVQSTMRIRLYQTIHYIQACVSLHKHTKVRTYLLCACKVCRYPLCACIVVYYLLCA